VRAAHRLALRFQRLCKLDWRRADAVSTGSRNSKYVAQPDRDVVQLRLPRQHLSMPALTERQPWTMQASTAKYRSMAVGRRSRIYYDEFLCVLGVYAEGAIKSNEQCCAVRLTDVARSAHRVAPNP
jgi:hypothetical protein